MYYISIKTISKRIDMKRLLLIAIVALFATSVQAQTLIIPEVQYSLITKRTATWCSICGGTAWGMMSDFVNNYADKSLAINAHHSSASDLHTDAAKLLIDNIEESFSQPTFYVNHERIGGGNSTTNASVIAKVNANFELAPLAQSAIHVEFDDMSGEIRVETETKFFADAQGDYRISLFVIEKEVIANQASQGPNTTHKNILRYNLSSDGFQEELFNGNITNGDFFAKNYSTTISEIGNLDVQNLLFATVIWKFENNSYTFVNCNNTDDVFITTSTRALPATIAQVELFPTITNNQSTLRVEVLESLENVAIQIFDASGKLVHTLFDGTLPGGQHTFEVKANAVSASGQYWVRLNSNQGQKSLPFILK
jgi:hypothetical protein